MTEEVTPTQDDTGPKTRLVLGIIVLILNVAAIAWLMMKGDSANLLHQNILSWSYILSTLILGGLGFGALLPTVLPYLKK